MIDIQPHLDKLDRLKEYMDAVLEYNPSVFRVIGYNTFQTNYTEPKKVYDRDGKLIYTAFGDSLRLPIIEQITFEEYLQLNN